MLVMMWIGMMIIVIQTYNILDTSYEKNGSVNRYGDNGDGGHSHDYWNNSSDYNNGNTPDHSRRESNSSSNPSIGEVQNNGGCYLTSACMNHMQDNFDDNCNELMTLRWFRDNFVTKDDIKHYYDVAPIIVDKINSIPDNNKIYKWIYEQVVQPCVIAIQKKDYEVAYNRYKNSILALEEQFINCELENNNIKTLKRIK